MSAFGRRGDLRRDSLRFSCLKAKAGRFDELHQTRRFLKAVFKKRSTGRGLQIAFKFSSALGIRERDIRFDSPRLPLCRVQDLP